MYLFKSPNNSKTCNKCGKKKPFSDFYKDRASKDGYHTICKECKNLDTKNWRQENKKRVLNTQRAYAKEYRKNNRRRIRSYARKYYRANTEKLAVKSYEAVLKNPDRKKSYGAIAHAVRIGKLPRAKTLKCIRCGKQAQEYHHHKGYEKPHWLDVVPVCTICHRFLENPIT